MIETQERANIMVVDDNRARGPSSFSPFRSFHLKQKMKFLASRQAMKRRNDRGG